MTGSAGHGSISSYTPTFALRLRKNTEYAARKTEYRTGDKISEAMIVEFLYRQPESKMESASQ
jgi:hypothetical protein